MEEKLGICCHDAGGAEMVSSWIRRNDLQKWVVLAELAGPAIDIFKRKLPEITRNLKGQPDLLVCGTDVTGFEAEFRVEMEGRTHGKVRTATYLDHWKNFAKRFEAPPWIAGLTLPDEVWVTDKFAHTRAILELGEGVKIVVKGNPYLLDIEDEVARLEKPASEGKARILVVYERGHDKTSYVDLETRWPKGSYVARHRLHPADAPSKHSLAEDIAWADVVVGWDSMALVAASTCNRLVYSVLPPEKRSIPVRVEQLAP